MPGELELARGWFLKAESDLNTAKRMAESDGPYDTACFHAQQAAEKYLKGLLAFRGQPFHRTHNLEELQHLGESLPAWPLAGLDLAELSSYAVEVRYDFEFWPDRRTTQEAVRLASEVRRLVLEAVPQNTRP
ncbi:MAG TPA: HEPN domain-containing protein [Terriglobia bacterium]|nr:HEPN domain-containing protein [Terriglobia bacterium]